MKEITVEEIENEKYSIRVDNLLVEIRDIIIDADNKVARGNTGGADKNLKKIEDKIVSFIMGEDVDMLDWKKFKGKKI